jgi:hypothetical protein
MYYHVYYHDHKLKFRMFQGTRAKQSHNSTNGYTTFYYSHACEAKIDTKFPNIFTFNLMITAKVG